LLLRFRALVPAYFPVGEYRANFCGSGRVPREHTRARARVNRRVYLVAATFVHADTHARKFAISRFLRNRPRIVLNSHAVAVAAGLIPGLC